MSGPSRPPLRLLSVDAAARDLDVSTKTVRRLIDRGDLQAHRVGRCLRISEEALRHYLHRVRT